MQRDLVLDYFVARFQGDREAARVCFNDWMSPQEKSDTVHRLGLLRKWEARNKTEAT